jgi:hypothetical protein
MPGTKHAAKPMMTKHRWIQGMGSLPARVTARPDWLVTRQFSVEKNWMARTITSSAAKVVF